MVFRKGGKVLSWSHEDCPGVVWSVPNRDVSSLRDYDEFVVDVHERCFRVRGGKLVEVSPGRHRLEDEDKAPGGAIYWCLVDRVWDMPFAVPRTLGLYTNDGVNIGFNGSVELKITDPLSFLDSLVAEGKSYSGGEFREWVSRRVASASRELVRQHSAEELHRREMGKSYINAVITASIFDELRIYGVEFLNIRIDGIVPPLREILDWKRVKAELENAEGEEIGIRRKIDQLDVGYSEGRIKAGEYGVLSKKYQEELGEVKDKIKELRLRLEALERRVR
ncbi:MAG: SPFH domain-containing protein [Candidatus Jordarchaeaceae archaeon]